MIVPAPSALTEAVMCGALSAHLARPHVNQICIEENELRGSESCVGAPNCDVSEQSVANLQSNVSNSRRKFLGIISNLQLLFCTDVSS